MTEAERLKARLAAMPGLVDVKFTLSEAAANASVEDVCREANAMLDAEAVPLDFSDSQRTP